MQVYIDYMYSKLTMIRSPESGVRIRSHCRFLCYRRNYHRPLGPAGQCPHNCLRQVSHRPSSLVVRVLVFATVAERLGLLWRRHVAAAELSQPQMHKAAVQTNPWAAGPNACTWFSS